MISLNKKYITLVILTFICSIAFGGGLPYYVFYFMVFSICISFIYIILIRHFIKAEVRINITSSFAGDKSECLNIISCQGVLPVPYVVINCSSDYYSLHKREAYLGNITISENIWIKNAIIFYHRGVINLGEIKVTVRDIFNIFSLEKIIQSDAYVKVYPKIYEVKSSDSRGIDIYRERLDIKSNIEDQFEIKDVRKYCEGDSLKKVHWKLSAKYGELLVKNQDNIYGEELSIFLDMNKKNLDYGKLGEIEELVIDTGVSIINEMIRKGIQVNVFTNTAVPGCFAIRDTLDYDNFVEHIIIQKSDGEEEFGKYIKMNCYKLHAANRIAVITAGIDDSFVNDITDIRNSGYNILTIYCFEDSENAADLRKNGVGCVYCGDFLNTKKAG